MRSLVAFLLLVAPCQAADWSFLKGDKLVQAKPVSVASCPCGDSCACVDCKCEDNATELRRLRAYKAKMEAWITEQDLRNPAKYKAVSAQVVTEQPVCVNGQCFLPSQGYRYSPATSTPYTSGNYTRWFSGFKSFRGGSCANGSCGR